MSIVHGIFTLFKRLIRLCLQSLHHRFVAWTTPDTTSLLLGTLTDQARSKSDLVAENAFLRKPLTILRRQVKRPACTRTDRMLLVLLARMLHTWKHALFIVQPETLLRWHRQGFKLTRTPSRSGHVTSSRSPISSFDRSLPSSSSNSRPGGLSMSESRVLRRMPGLRNNSEKRPRMGSHQSI